MVGGRGDNVDTNFARGATYKIWEGKNVQNSARCLTIFDFDGEYLQDGSTKIGKVVDQLYWAKKIR